MKKRKKMYKKKSSYKYLVLVFLFILILFLIFLLVKNIFMPENVIFKPKSHSDDIIEMKKKYKSKNYDVVGWLDVDGTNLNMPVLKAINETGDYPVTMKRYAWSLSDNNKYYNFMAILGHNIMNLGIPKTSDSSFYRFEELMAFVYDDFADKHKYFQYTLNGKTYVYKIFSVSLPYSIDVYDYPKFGASKEKQKKLINKFKNDSIYKYDVDVDENDDILALVTCTRLLIDDGYHDMVIVGKKIEDDEKATDYTLTKTAKYKKIENILKGDDKDEK